MSEKKLVFISHPYSDAPSENIERVDEICRRIIAEEPNTLPVSPLHLFLFMPSDEGLRDEILGICRILINACDEVRFYCYPNGLSPGQKEELEWALGCNVPVKIIPHARGGEE